VIINRGVDSPVNGWRSLAKLPEPRDYLGAIESNNGYIDVFGGGDYPYTSNKVFQYESRTNKWMQLGNMPDYRHSYGYAKALDGMIYLIGGDSSFGGEQLNTMNIYNPVNDSWSAGPNMPTARDLLAAIAASNGKIYAIGGRPAGDVVEEYDPLTGIANATCWIRGCSN
jgi:N-acetylneuraminic acid mutarotase